MFWLELKLFLPGLFPPTVFMQINLRPWQMSDAETLAGIANNPRIAANMMDGFPHPYTLDNAKAFINAAVQVLPANILAIEVNGAAAGGIGIHQQTDIYRMNAELGYWLAEEYWGRGVITIAIKQMTAYAFRNWNISRIYARPFGRNIASAKALQKAGFILEGRFEKTIFKNGVYEDELVYAIRR